jgi:hypothetical protein
MVLHGLSRPLRAVHVGLLAALIGLAAPSCHKMPLVAPSGSGLTLVATTNVLPVNGATDILAVVIEGAQSAGTGNTPGEVLTGVGTPVQDGTLVTFATTLGRLEPGEARTKAGKASVRLIADGRSGTATVTAFSGAASGTLEVDIGAAGATRLAVTASPQELPPAGGTTTIAARVEDQQGNGVAGVPVSFSATKGSLSNPTALSTDLGVATTQLTTTAESTVTASAGGSATALSGTVLVTLRPRTTLAITPPTNAMAAVPAAFTVTPGTNTVITDVTLDFGDGDRASLGGITGATTVSHVYRSSNVYTVTARATDAQGVTTPVSTQVAVSNLVAAGSASPSTSTAPRPGDVVTFTVTPAANALITSYVWDFGDGGDPVATSSNQITHSYTTAGPKITSVRLLTVGGGTAATVLIPVDVKP